MYIYIYYIKPFDWKKRGGRRKQHNGADFKKKNLDWIGGGGISGNDIISGGFKMELISCQGWWWWFWFGTRIYSCKVQGNYRTYYKKN